MLFLGVLAVSGCSPEEPGVFLPGSEIIFGASTLWQNGPATRTEYSGKDQNDSPINATDSEYERINWVKNTDHIRIYSPEAAKLDGTTHVQDYYISSDPVFPASPDAKKSQANIACTDANGLQWAAGSGSQHFFALYPAPGTKWKYDQTKVVPTPPQSPQASDVYAKIEPGTDNAHAVVTAVVPSVQEVFWNASENEYEPNMNYAYMYAATTGTRGNGVLLSFKPLVTAIRFTLKMKDGELKLKTFKLKSSTVDLSGTFTATVSTSGNPTFGTPTGTTKDISLSIPATQQQTLTTSGTVTVTVLTLPVDLTDLSIEMSFLNSSNAEVIRTLDLKTRASASDPYTPIQVDACHKSYINDLGIPGTFEYELSVTGPSEAFSNAVGTKNYTVTSYKTVGGASLGVNWTAEFSTDNGKTWSPNKPSWLTGFTSSGAGSDTPATFNATVAANNSTATKTWQGNPDQWASAKADAIDLARIDANGNPGSTKRTTANSYIVSRPGWYKFPCIYGNGFKNGGNNAAAYNTYVRHDDHTITGPYIQNDITALWEDAHRSVALLWQDSNGLVSDLSSQKEWVTEVGDLGAVYFYFKVNTPIRQGNAVIALLCDGTIVWSWHIWVIEESKVTTTRVQNSSDATGGYVDMMDVNLGWVDANTLNGPRSVLVRITQAHSGKKAIFEIDQNGADGQRQGRYLLYQWGRKDPLMGNTDNSISTQPTVYPTGGSYLYNNNGSGQGRDGRNATTPTIGNVTQNPYKFYKGYYWSRPRNDLLWNKNGAWNSDVAVAKTVYDPCPKGYKVPNMKAFTGFTRDRAVGSYEYGWHFRATETGTETIFMPRGGFRHIDSSFRDGAEYWTAAITEHASEYVTTGEKVISPYFFEFSDTGFSPLQHTGPIGFGFAVRCIKDD